jgi:hypothetical protein
MRTVRYVGSANRYRLTQDGVDIEAGEAETVDDDLAEYLLDRDDFEAVETADSDGGDEPTIADQIDAGECPWCDEYEGENVGQHAASAHTDAWDDYKED